MFRSLLSKRAWLSVATAGAFLPATIVCEVPNIDIRFGGYDDDDGYVIIEDDCCYDDYYYDWWWF